MKKIIIFCSAVLLTSFGAFAQGEKPAGGGDMAFHKDAVVFSAGYGFPNFGKSILKLGNNSNFTATGFGPWHLKGEIGLSDKVGLGLSLNNNRFGGKWNGDSSGVDNYYNYDVSVNSIAVNVRMNFHFATTDKLDPYFGLGFGYRSNTWKAKTNDNDYSTPGTLIPLGFEITVGMRYYVSKNIGIYVEAGPAKSFIQGGLAVKL